MLTPDGVLKQGSDPVRQAGLRNRGVDLSAIYPARHGLVKPREVLTLTSQEAEVPAFVTKNVSSNGVAAVGGRLSLRSGERACGVQMGRAPPQPEEGGVRGSVVSHTPRPCFSGTCPRRSGLPKVTQLVTGRAGMCTQNPTPGPGSYPYAFTTASPIPKA